MKSVRVPKPSATSTSCWSSPLKMDATLMTVVGADQHAQDGQEGAELVRPQGVQRKQQIFTNVVALGGRHAQFSVRKASMGSSLAAWLAG